MGGARLSYNLLIKGGYSAKNEDHRWALIRTWFQGREVAWKLFILFFVNIYQMMSVYAFSTLPLYVIYHGPPSMQLHDLPLAIAFCGFLCIETIADHQMWLFQEGKKKSNT